MVDRNSVVETLRCEKEAELKRGRGNAHHVAHALQNIIDAISTNPRFSFADMNTLIAKLYDATEIGDPYGDDEWVDYIRETIADGLMLEA